jgi:hypothetical protein
MVRLAPGGTVPMLRLYGRSLDIMVACTSASKLAEESMNAAETGSDR